MKKGKRILAIAGVVILVALYLITLVSAFLATPATKNFFVASLLATIIIPILLYIYMMLYRLIKKDEQEEEAEAGRDRKMSVSRKGFEEAFYAKQGKTDKQEGKEVEYDED